MPTDLARLMMTQNMLRWQVNNLSMMDMQRAEKAKQSEARIDALHAFAGRAMPWVLLVAFFVGCYVLRSAR